MSEQERFQEKLAAYRDLSASERERLQAELAADPEAAELLDAFREMDRRLAELPRPAPDAKVRREFYAALERETGGARAGGIGGLLKRAPALASQGAGGAVLLLLLLAFGYLFREQLQLAAAPQTATPQGVLLVGTATSVAAPPDAGPLPTPTPTPAPLPTPTAAVVVDPADPFAPFRHYMALWPEQSGMAHGALRAGMISFLEQHGSVHALADPAVMDTLQAQLEPAAPDWGEYSLRLLELSGSSAGPELVVAVLPFVDVYELDADGVFRVSSIGPPRYWPVEETWPSAVEAMDFSGDGAAELVVTYDYARASELAQEVVVAQYDPERRYWAEQLRLPLAAVARTAQALAVSPVEVVSASPANTDAPGYVESYCLAYGAFDAPWSAATLRRDVYAWYGTGMEQLLFDRTEPSNLRQYVNVAEAYLQEGKIGEALRRYTLLYRGEIGLPREEPAAPDAGQPDWEAFASLRAGQLHALLGEHEAAREALGRALLSSTEIGRLAGIFAERYGEAGNAAIAWSALLADPAIYEAHQRGGRESGDPGSFVQTVYPGLALAAALNTSGVAQSEDLQPERLLPLWAEYGLVSSGRVMDIDLDGAPEIIVAQPLPDEAAPLLVQVSVLDAGDDGWFAAPMGELPGAWSGLPEPELGPDGAYQLLQLGSVYAGWDGRYVHHFKGSYYGDELVWLHSTEPAHLCPLRAEELVAVNEAMLSGERATSAAPTPTLVRPTLDAWSLTATAQPTVTSLPLEMTPTPWDGHQDNMVTPTAPPPLTVTPEEPPGPPAPTATLPATVRVEPVVEGLLQMGEWSPDGRYLSFLRFSAEEAAQPPPYAGTLSFYDTAEGEECAFAAQPYDGSQQGAVHAWLHNGELLAVVGGQLVRGAPCGGELLPIAAVGAIATIFEADKEGRHFLLQGEDGDYLLLTTGSADAFSVQPLAGAESTLYAAFSPGGRYLGINRQTGGSITFSVESGEVLQEISWQYPVGSMGAVPFTWVDESSYVIGASQSGPLLVQVAGEPEELAPALFQMASSAQQEAAAVATAGDDYAVLLQTPRGEPWLYRSATGTARQLSGQSARLHPAGVEITRSRPTPDEPARIEIWWLAFERPEDDPYLLWTGGQGATPGIAPSPAGSALALVAQDYVFLYNAERERAFRLGDYPFPSPGYAQWSPTGRWLAISAGYSGRQEQGVFLLPGR